MAKLMDDLVRIYYPTYGEPEKRNWFDRMTGIGPAFGATLENTPVLTRKAALDLVDKFPMMCDWEFELVSAGSQDHE